MSRIPGSIVLVAASAWFAAAGGCSKAPESNAAPEASGTPTGELHSDPAIRQLQEFIRARSAQSDPVGRIHKDRPDWRTMLPKPPQVAFTPGKTYKWKLDTNVGAMTIKLFPDVAPMHVSSCLYLTELGFYDGLTFHRVMQGFMAQGGDPLGTGMGDPGYEFAGEFSPTVRHDRPFLLSTANGGPGTDSSQFFITFAPTQFLDGKHTIYGEVIEGLSTVRALEAAGAPQGSSSEAPREKLVIVKATYAVD